MATYGYGIDLPFTASGDLGSYQYRFVKAASLAKRVDLANGASNPLPLGVLQNDPDSLDSAQVRIYGETKVWYSSSTAINYGAFLMSGSAGGAETAGTVAGSSVQGISLEDAAPAGSGYISMLLWPANSIVAGLK